MHRYISYYLNSHISLPVSLDMLMQNICVSTKRDSLFSCRFCLLVRCSLVHYNLVLGFGIYVIYTMYHSIKQQTGIAGLRIGASRNNTLHTLWTAVAVSIGILGNFYVLMPPFVQDFPIFRNMYFLSSCMLALIFVSIFYLHTLRKTSSPISFWYTLATSTLLLMLCMHSCRISILCNLSHTIRT